MTRSCLLDLFISPTVGFEIRVEQFLRTKKLKTRWLMANDFLDELIDEIHSFVDVLKCFLISFC